MLAKIAHWWSQYKVAEGLKENMLEQYLKRTKTSVLVAVAAGLLLGGFEMQRHGVGKVLVWWLILYALVAINFFYAKKSLVKKIGRAADRIAFNNFLSGLAVLAVWVSFPFIFGMNEQSYFETYWRGSIIFIVMLFNLNMMSYSILATLFNPLVLCLSLMFYLFHYTGFDSSLRIQMAVALCLGTLLIFIYSLLGFRLNLAISKIIVEHSRLIGEMDELLIHDNLTNQYNRRYFDMQLLRYIETYRLSGQYFCIGMMDIDYFKSINDTYGHQYGDKILVQLSAFVKQSLRSTDLFARYGGEEFAVLLPMTYLDTAEMVLNKVRQNVEEQLFGDDDLKLKLRMSIGVTVVSEGDGKESLVRQADQALYQAKALGRNSVVTFNKKNINEELVSNG